ncbi:MAG: MOSC domain-containing protein [Anaerolineae bacterium]|nr:MOSC domain-containing protein [Anaerolineae bacterium]MDW8172899.1 MOSC domain-containing protein [Anaerolineae bacterium]
MTPLIRSVQVGRVQTFTAADGTVWTSAYRKMPVDQPVWLSALGLEGDEQQHKKVHGGPFRAVLSYSAEHYLRWQQELGLSLPYGAFGENFTISGLDEDSVCLGDVYQVGDEVCLEVAQPRRPCNQINLYWGRDDLQALVSKTLRTGWYARVLQEGRVCADMSVRLLSRPYPEWTIRAAHETYDERKHKPKRAHALAQCEALETSWRERLAQA